MIIESVELWHVAIPLPAPFYPSWIPGFPQTKNHFDLIRIRTQSGLEGIAAGAAFGHEKAGFGSILGPYLIGERADDIATIQQRVRELSYLGIRVGWIEPACWDIIGKARNKPVYELLGGQSGTVKLYASTGEIKTPAQRIIEVEQRMAEGFDTVKLRVHDFDPADDERQIVETRKAVGDDVALGVDANQAWRVAVVADAPKWDYNRALRFCQVAEQAGYSWVEEPLPMEAYDDLAKLRSNTQIAIAGAELNNYGLPEFGTMLEKGCYDWYQPDATFTGGISGTWAIIQKIAAAGNARYTPHTWTNGIGFAINLQLYAASPWREQTLLEYPYNPPGWMPLARDGLLKTPWLHERGTLELPTMPGLGIELDRKQLRRYGTRFYKATKLRVAVQTVLDKGIRVALEAGKKRDARMADNHADLVRRETAGEDIVAAFCQAAALKEERT